MSATIEVNEQTARNLYSLARDKGMSVDDLLLAYVPGLSPSVAPNGKESQVDRIDAFVAWAKRHSTTTPLLSDDAVSRSSFYDE